LIVELLILFKILAQIINKILNFFGKIKNLCRNCSGTMVLAWAKSGGKTN
jgi:hypothetical protein